MANKTERLVLVGGVDLGFRDGSGAKRRAVRDQEFEVDAATAEILLTDPNVQRVGDAPRAIETPATREPTKKELLARAAELRIEGVGDRMSNAAITEAIAAKEAELEAASTKPSGSPREQLSAMSDEDLAKVAEHYEVPTADLDRDALIAALLAKAGYETDADPAAAEGGIGSGGAITLGDLPAGAKVGPG